MTITNSEKLNPKAGQPETLREGELSMTREERARKNLTIMISSLAKTGQKTAADCMDVHESTVSRMKDGELEKFAGFLAACGLKVVPQHFRCARPEIIEAYETLARAAINQNCTKALIFDDD